MNNTPFDDVYKTIQEKFPRLLIPLVNEQFHTNYAWTEEIINLGQEFHKLNGVVVADSVFRICNQLYHTECQSNPDGTIAIRMFEYDFYIAMKEAEKQTHGVYRMYLPKSCILYLRHTKETKDELSVELVAPDGQILTYHVPVVKVQRYTLDEIFEKKLFLFLPFYIMRYEKNKALLRENEEQMNELIEEYTGMIKRMENAFYAEQGEEGMRIAAELNRLMKEISDYIFRNEDRLRKRIGGTIMGGTALKTLGEEIEELIAMKQELEVSNQKKIRENRILKALIAGKSKEEVARQESISMKEIEELIK